MNIQDLGSIGEFVGSFAVLVTVFYLALQMRQLRRTMHVASSQAMSQAFNDTCNAIISSPDFAKTFAKAKENYDSLEAWERELLSAFLTSFLNNIWTSYEIYRVGSTHDLAIDTLRQLSVFLAYPGAREHWESYRNMYDQNWQSIVDEKIAGDA